MNLYETVKAAVPLREAAARYGLRQNWSGMTRCLYHEDHTPSMKLNEDYFYCFGCGSHGDVIDLTSAIFGLPPFDAARKLAWDFHVPLDKPVDPPRQSEVSPEVKADLARRKGEQEQLWTCLRVLCEYQRLLRRWKEQYFPRSPNEPVDDRYVEACQMYDRIDDLTEGLTVGTEDQRKRALELVTADNKITLLAERLERLRKEEEALAEEAKDFQSAPTGLV